MSVAIITSAWTFFQKLPKDDFTSTIRHAIAMTELIKDFNKADKKRLLWLRDYTHKNIMTSIYELDRYVDPTKGKYRNESITLRTGKVYTQDHIQKYLCIAIEEATSIIYKNFKDFKVESKLNLDSLENNETNEDEDWNS